MIVIKFGGTSVQDAPAMVRAIQAVEKQLDRKPAVVLSAMGKTTDKLLKIAEKAHRGEVEAARGISRDLKGHYLRVARELLTGTRLLKTEDRLGGYFEEISNIIQGLYLLGECTPRSRDAIASFGERMSSLIFAETLGEKGHPVALLDSREFIRTDDDFTRAAVLEEVSFPKIREQVAPQLDDGRLVVLPGFVGSTVDGITTTIGRGGSDYTASLVGAALQVKDIQIWTDVPGILTADPRIVPEVYKIKAISFSEASELAYFGAQVLHPSTLIPAVSRTIPVHVCDSSKIDQIGTLISASSIPCQTPVKSLACKKGITLLNIHSTRMLLAYGFLHRIFEVFDRRRTVVDVVATSEVDVSLTIDSAANLQAILNDLRAFGRVDVEPNVAIICIVGDNLRNTPGVAARIFQALDVINVRMISQGASHINVTFIVQEDKMEDAVRQLHDEFFTEPDPQLFEAIS
ncbi:lysine-sensitive aspartokinase 3 [Acidobacteria bacterium AH-259-L09]|nr:lysine-sensitive aspartokinase 3 [Acidobacteria bacterium AH-259-L09]